MPVSLRTVGKDRGCWASVFAPTVGDNLGAPSLAGVTPGVDLFASAVEERLARKAPLAARLRPRTLDEVVGQVHLLRPGKPLRGLFESDRLPSAILRRPP